MRSISLIFFCAALHAADWVAPKPGAFVPAENFTLPEDLEITVWASTPQVFNPTNMDTDQAGRIYVCEGVNYRSHEKRRPEGDRIVVLEDKDHDGKAESSHTFVQDVNLVAPLGIAVFDNRIVVSQPPDLLIYTDVNRDQVFDEKVDKKEVFLTGFNAKNHDHSLHKLVAGPDGKWYINNGNCGAGFTDKSGKKFLMGGDYYKSGGGHWFEDVHAMRGKKSDDGFVYTAGFTARVNPDGTHAEIVGYGYRNSFENCLNSYGEVFQNDNDDPPACRTSYVLEKGSAGYFTRDGAFFKTVKRPGQDYGRAHWRQDDPGTFDVGDIYGGGAPTGITYYENGALPEKYNGTLLSCEPTRNVIFSYNPEVKNATYKLERNDFITTNKEKNFDGADFTGGIKKKDASAAEKMKLLFRPSDIIVGADGALYVSDWYDARVGGHGDVDDSCSGTIYRIAPKGFTPQIKKIDLNTLDGAIAALRSPAVNVRFSGFEELKKRGAAAIPAVSDLLKDKNQYVAARGIWLLPYLGDAGKAQAVKMLGNENELIRMTAFRALVRAGVDTLPYAKKLSADPSAAVRKEVAISLRGRPVSETGDVFVTLAKMCDVTDKNSLEAIGIGAANQEEAVWTLIKKTMAPSGKWTDKFAKITWRLWNKSAVPELKARALDASLTLEQRMLALESLVFIRDPSAAAAVIELATQNSPVKAEAMRWLLVRNAGEWRSFKLGAELKKRGIYDPDKVVLNSIQVPMQPKTPTIKAEDVAALKGDAAKGKNMALRCTMCHNINDAGPHYGPELKGWVARQGVDSAIKAIVDPNADIAHGFDGEFIELKDGKGIIDGLIAGDTDPVSITSTGGVTQLVPKKFIQHQGPMGRSAMMSPDALSLSAQDIADIVAWLKDYK